MVNDGCIKLHRKIIENAVFYKPDYFQIWIYILLKARTKKANVIVNGVKYSVDKGCVIFAKGQISKELKFAPEKVGEILNWLKEENQILYEVKDGNVEVKVINWKTYQDITKEKPFKETVEEQQKKEDVALVFPFDTDRFRQCWGIWLEHKIEIKAIYKTLKGQQAALKELSVFDEAFAIQLIETSISRGWQGLVYHKTKKEYEEYKNSVVNGQSTKGSGRNKINTERISDFFTEAARQKQSSGSSENTE